MERMAKPGTRTSLEAVVNGYNILGTAPKEGPFIRRDGSRTTEDDPQRLLTRDDLRTQQYWIIGATILGTLVGTIVIRWLKRRT